MDFCEHCNSPVKRAGSENGEVTLDAGPASRYVVGESDGTAKATLVNTWQEHVCPVQSGEQEEPALAEVGAEPEGEENNDSD